MCRICPLFPLFPLLSCSPCSPYSPCLLTWNPPSVSGSVHLCSLMLVNWPSLFPPTSLLFSPTQNPDPPGFSRSKDTSIRKTLWTAPDDPAHIQLLQTRSLGSVTHCAAYSEIMFTFCLVHVCTCVEFWSTRGSVQQSSSFCTFYPLQGSIRLETSHVFDNLGGTADLNSRQHAASCSPGNTGQLVHQLLRLLHFRTAAANRVHSRIIAVKTVLYFEWQHKQLLTHRVPGQLLLKQCVPVQCPLQNS
jgi:hypothetical protein